MEIGEIEAEMEKMKLGIHDLKEEIDRLRSRLNEIEERMNDDPPIRIKIIRGKKGGVVAKVMRTGHVVLFNDEPSEDEIGNIEWMTDHDLRESKRTGNEYYKCFEHEEKKPKETEALESERRDLNDELEEKTVLRDYLRSQLDDLKRRHGKAKIREILSDAGISKEEVEKTYETAKLGLTNTLTKFNGGFDRVMFGETNDWSSPILTLVIGEEIVRCSGLSMYLDNPPIDFYTEITYDTQEKKENDQITLTPNMKEEEKNE